MLYFATFEFMDENPLKKLIVDVEELDKEKLTSLIQGYLGISKKGEIVILSDFNELTTKSKIITLLLARKASKAMSLHPEDSTTPKEIVQMTGLPKGTVGRELFELKQLRLVDKNEGYFVPDHAVHTISIEKSKKKISGQKTKMSPGKKRRKMDGSRKRVQVETSDKINELLRIKQETLQPEMISLMLQPGSYLERALAVLKIARDNGIEDLTPAEIETFLKEKIRVKIWKSNISLYLGKKGAKYVDRFRNPNGSGFTYRLMASGEQLLEEALKKIKGEKKGSGKEKANKETKG